MNKEEFIRSRAITEWNHRWNAFNYKSKPIADKVKNVEDVVEWYKNQIDTDYFCKDEIIPMELWDPKGLFGQTEEQFFHPHYQRIVEYSLTHPKKYHPILFVTECSNKKPYTANSILKRYFRAFGDYCDFCVLDYGLLPLNYCEKYPYSLDNWSHKDETPYEKWFYKIASEQNFRDVIESYGYKYIIQCVHHPDPRLFLTNMQKENRLPKGLVVKNVFTDEFDVELWEKYKDTFKNYGIFITRKMQLKEVYQRSVELVKEAISESINEVGSSDGSSIEFPNGIFTYKDNRLDKFIQSKQEVSLDKLKNFLEKESPNVLLRKDFNETMPFNDNLWCWGVFRALYFCDRKVDHQLASRYNAYHEAMKQDPDFVSIGRNCFVYKPMIETLGWSIEEARKYAVKIGMTENLPLEANGKIKLKRI